MPVHDDLGITPLKCPYCKTPMRLTCVVRKPNDKGYSEWVIDKEIPIFKGEGREYIDVLVEYVEDK